MTDILVPTIEEAKAIAQSAIDMANDGTRFENFPSDVQIQALAGIINSIKGMQLLGWRVSRPLSVVK